MNYHHVFAGVFAILLNIHFWLQLVVELNKTSSCPSTGILP